eukprot:3740519-Prymnesium_polylepis.1
MVKRIIDFLTPWPTLPRVIANKNRASRWEYLHSFFHGAGYAFDPEFIENTHDWDAAVSNGVMVMEVMERLCLRDCMIENTEKHDDPQTALTTTSAVVVEKVAACELELSKYKEGVYPQGGGPEEF